MNKDKTKCCNIICEECYERQCLAGEKVRESCKNCVVPSKESDK